MTPNAIFDLAINRADTFLRGSRPTNPEAALAQWHARTRFARRVPLAEVWRCLALRPETIEMHWQGGPAGAWQVGKAPFP